MITGRINLGSGPTNIEVGKTVVWFDRFGTGSGHVVKIESDHVEVELPNGVRLQPFLWMIREVK